MGVRTPEQGKLNRACHQAARALEGWDHHETSRYSVALASALARQVETYADTSDISVSKAVAALVRQGLESQEGRKREFFKKLRTNLANSDPKIEDQMVD